MKPREWKTYRTRFLVKAKQLSSSLSFVDALGRQHSGRKGDYLVESFDGVISIAPRQIFEDIYVAMSATTDITNDVPGISNRMIDKGMTDRVMTGKVMIDKEVTDRRTIDKAMSDAMSDAMSNETCNRLSNLISDKDHVGLPSEALRRKLPQPSHTRRPPSPRLGLM